MAYEAVLQHIDSYWTRIIRENREEHGTLIALPRPYLVPSDDERPDGGKMFQELYYWDSFFMALGVIGTPHAHLARAMADNLAYLFERFGVIPNASRYYFLSRSQPPLLTAHMRLVYEHKLADIDWLTTMVSVAAREHEAVWMGTEQPHHRITAESRGLSRYFDINYLDTLASCESGWDHSTRCDDRWLSHLPVDLNSILYLRERDIAWGLREIGYAGSDLTPIAVTWEARAERRRATIQSMMWDDEAGFFFDYDLQYGERNPHVSLAGFYPLWAGVATDEQARTLVETWLPPFTFPGGLVTTLKAQDGRQWAYPNGWAPLQWLIAAGLERYGYGDAAQTIMRAWCDNVASVFERTGAIWEKYNVVEPNSFDGVDEGLYGQMRGFGWTNGVFVDFARRLNG
ncbi:MAG: trehalase family glycosidase [Chloroflexota bacterium]|nr:trehalase family glycosidase [Chloroflexota bacterium]